MRKKIKVYQGCELQSNIYREILSSKNNQKVLSNGDTYIDAVYAINSKTNRVYKISNK